MRREYLPEVDGVAGRAGSPWLAAEAVTHPALPDGEHVDVAIIGGGLVGCLCAYYLAHSGAKVALVERRRIAAGVTGHTTAKVTVQHGLSWQQLAEHHGAERVAPYAAENLAAVDEIERIVNLEGISCAFGRVPSAAYALNAEHADELKREQEVYRSVGIAGSLQEITPPFQGALGTSLVVERQAIFDPAAFCVGCLGDLANSAIIAEQTSVRDIAEKGDHVIVHHDGGELHADQVIMASHFPVMDTAAYFSRLFAQRSYAFLVRTPKPWSPVSWIGVGHGLTFRPLSIDDSNQVIVGGVHHKAGQGGDERECYAELARSTREMAGDVEFLSHWSTQDYHSVDGLPVVGRAPRTKRLYLAAGFDGWGMTKGVVAARRLTQLVEGAQPQLADLLDPGRADLLEDVAEFSKENIDVVKHVAQGLLPDSEHHRRCTHLGCRLETNEAELTEDCPCHGSRYTADGVVLDGPARKDLHLSS